VAGLQASDGDPQIVYLSAWKHLGFAQNSFRLTVLVTPECPQTLQHFWSGHAHEHVFERYKKLKTNRQLRLDWVEKIGLGFSVGPLGPPQAVRSAA